MSLLLRMQFPLGLPSCCLFQTFSRGLFSRLNLGAPFPPGRSPSCEGAHTAQQLPVFLWAGPSPPCCSGGSPKIPQEGYPPPACGWFNADPQNATPLALTARLRGCKGLTPFWQKGIRAPWPAHTEGCLWCWSMAFSWLEMLQWEKRTETHIGHCLCLPEGMCCHPLAGLPAPHKSGLFSSIWQRQKSKKKVLTSHKHPQSWSIFSPFGYTSMFIT